MRISSKWLQGVSKEERNNASKIINSYINNDDFVIERLREIIGKRIKELSKGSREDYDKASWPYFQAHRLGQLESMEEILTLISKDDKPANDRSI